MAATVPVLPILGFCGLAYTLQALIVAASSLGLGFPASPDFGDGGFFSGIGAVAGYFVSLFGWLFSFLTFGLIPDIPWWIRLPLAFVCGGGFMVIIIDFAIKAVNAVGNLIPFTLAFVVIAAVAVPGVGAEQTQEQYDFGVDTLYLTTSSPDTIGAGDTFQARAFIYVDGIGLGESIDFDHDPTAWTISGCTVNGVLSQESGDFAESLRINITHTGDAFNPCTIHIPYAWDTGAQTLDGFAYLAIETTSDPSQLAGSFTLDIASWPDNLNVTADVTVSSWPPLLTNLTDWPALESIITSWPGLTIDSWPSLNANITDLPTLEHVILSWPGVTVDSWPALSAAVTGSLSTTVSGAMTVTNTGSINVEGVDITNGTFNVTAEGALNNLDTMVPLFFWIAVFLWGGYTRQLMVQLVGFLGIVSHYLIGDFPIGEAGLVLLGATAAFLITVRQSWRRNRREQESSEM